MRSSVVALAFAIALASCRPNAPRDTERVAPSADASADAGVNVNAEADADADANAGADADAASEALTSDWCIAGMRVLDEDVCYVLPPLPADRPRRLLVYLHGITPPVRSSAQKDAVQNAVRNAATRAGAAAIVPRGRRGIGPTGAHDWWAWPTDPASHAQLVKAIVLRWAEQKAKLERITGAPFARTYLAGSSNGAYFLAALALRGDADDLGFPIDGYGAMSGGAPGGRGADALAHRTPRPFYIGYGAHDDDSKHGARALAAVTTAAHWPTTLREHPFGHGAREIYLDEAFAAWDTQ